MSIKWPSSLATNERQIHPMPSTSKRAADYRVSNLETCFQDIEQATESAILHLCYTIHETLEPTNVLIIYATGDRSKRLEAVAEFRKLVEEKNLSEDEGLHHHNDSWIVISNSVHWGTKYQFFLDFEES
jgi:hypothetical protein